MAVNLDAIRKRVQEMTGQRKTSSVQLWKPGPGEYLARIVPWKSSQVVDGMPFIERRFYYLGDNPRILCPSQFGKPDPVYDLIRKLYSTKSPEDRELAKKLKSKLTAYAALVVRGEEDKDVQVLSLNTFQEQRLLGLFMKASIGDFTDPVEGFDLEITVAPSPKKFNGKTVMDWTFDVARKQTKLHDDPKVMQRWLDNLPNVDDMLASSFKTEKEIEQILNVWLAGGADDSAKEDGSTRGGEPGKKDALDDLAEDIKGSKPVEQKSAATKVDEPAKKPSRGKKPAADADLDAEPAPKKSLDDAFNELMEEEGDE